MLPSNKATQNDYLLYLLCVATLQSHKKST